MLLWTFLDVRNANGAAISRANVWITYSDSNTNPNACVVVGPAESQMFTEMELVMQL